MVQGNRTNKGYWIGGATALVIAVIVLVFALLDGDNPSGAPRPHPTNTVSATAPPSIHQAKWRVHAFPAGLTSQATKKQRKTAHLEGLRAARGIEDVYNAVFLQPSLATRSVRRHFERHAARAFLRAKTRPPQMNRTQITYRSMHIGVDARTSQRAIATVTILSRGIRNSKRAKIKHESTLWLERVHRVWKVLAFRADQGTPK